VSASESPQKLFLSDCALCPKNICQFVILNNQTVFFLGEILDFLYVLRNCPDMFVLFASCFRYHSLQTPLRVQRLVGSHRIHLKEIKERQMNSVLHR
jgi:hypothetical protein